MRRSGDVVIVALVILCLAAAVVEIVMANPEPVPPRGPVLYVTWNDRFDLYPLQAPERAR